MPCFGGVWDGSVAPFGVLIYLYVSREYNNLESRGQIVRRSTLYRTIINLPAAIPQRSKLPLTSMNNQTHPGTKSTLSSSSPIHSTTTTTTTTTLHRTYTHLLEYRTLPM
ncbi:hypothetical protein L873DRAFT_1798001 [Choiromyces venosus 120613-1]|uniref:Uncharacterized protein n=1 Tax=Choiromyces venosus 120613-1 TaxID=1336337 RepID=A0A3N4K9D3_9PEZI|nr:hypothetical protein L873DRAFT_1798001 [Choiromyces venosus 120613-1]